MVRISFSAAEKTIKPIGPEEILYHYTSNDTLISILKNRELWAHQLTLANDRMEGLWLREVFEAECCKTFSVRDAAQAMESFDAVANLVDAVGFCLSEERDSLGQWRAYANDGAGVCIGFSVKSLRNLCEMGPTAYGTRLSPVVYDEAQQISIVQSIIEGLRFQFRDDRLKAAKGKKSGQRLADKKNEETPQELSHRLQWFFATFLWLFTMKNPSFSQEREWRLFAYYIKRWEPFLLESGENAMSLDYLGKFDRISPVLRLPVSSSDSHFVREIILGPKNITPPHVVAGLAERYGLVDVSIFRSTTTYR